MVPARRLLARFSRAQRSIAGSLPITGCLTGLAAIACAAVVLLAGGTQPARAEAPTPITDCSDPYQLEVDIAAGGSYVFACEGTIQLHEEMTVSGNLSLNGGGKAVTIDAAPHSRLFDVVGGHVALIGLTLVGGSLSVAGENGENGENGEEGEPGLNTSSCNSGVGGTPCPPGTNGGPGGDGVDGGSGGDTSATAQGGGIFIGGGAEVTLSGDMVEGMAVVSSGGSGGAGGSGGQGGAAGEGSCWAAGCHVEAGGDGGEGANGGNGGAGASAQGGAVYVSAGATLSVHGGTFESDLVESAGGTGGTGGSGGSGAPGYGGCEQSKSGDGTGGNGGDGGAGGGAGNAEGGAIYSAGTLALEQVTFEYDSAYSTGGGGGQAGEAGYGWGCNVPTNGAGGNGGNAGNAYGGAVYTAAPLSTYCGTSYSGDIASETPGYAGEGSPNGTAGGEGAASGTDVYGTSANGGEKCVFGKIAGKILTPQGDGEGGVTVNITGAASYSAKTASDGSYSVEVQTGTYTVTPAPTNLPAGADEFEPEHCPGTPGANDCENIAVEAEKEAVANFSAGFTLSGKVVGASGTGVEGATVSFQDEEQGTRKNASATTDGDGEFKERLAPGSVTATVNKQGATEFFPVASEDCKPSNASCEVNLNQDRKVEFTACVVPNPNGEPLPANTPEQIPGAQTVGNLEAVGCWTPQPDGTYTSTKPVRLDGIDVNPAEGTTITLHPDATVTSNGPAKIGPGKLFAIPVSAVDLNFQAAQMQAADLGTGAPTAGVPMSVAGVPFSLTTGSTLQTLDPPWISSVGKTTMTINLQLPVTLNATSWNVARGEFLNGGTTVPSVGGVLTATATNREGVTAPEACAKFTGGEFKLWSLEKDTSWISQATACYDFNKGKWTLTGLFELPAKPPWNKAPFNKVNVSVGWENGWNWSDGSIEVDGINAELDDGVYLQRLGASFHRDFTKVPPTTSNFAVRAGLSFGPQLNKSNAGKLVQEFPALNGAELFSLDGEGLFQLWSNPAYIKLSGNILLLRHTPLQATLAGGYVDYYTSGRFDLGGELRLNVPFVHWGLDGQMSGFLDTTRNVTQLSGTVDLALPLVGETKAQALINNTALVACISRNGSYSAGGVWNMANMEVKLFAPNTCEIGAYTLSAPETPSFKASASRVGQAAAAAIASPRISTANGPIPPTNRLTARARRGASAAGIRTLRLPAHLSGTTIAVRGSGAAPRVYLRGPGLTLDSPPGGKGVLSKRALLVQDDATNTTYITLYSPRGGSWRIGRLPGSRAIVSVRAALPAPRARVHVHLSAKRCKRTLTYRARVPHGERLELYAENGSERTFLGSAHRRGHVSFTPDPSARGKGQIVGVEMRGALTRRVFTVVKFAPKATKKQSACASVAPKQSGRTQPRARRRHARSPHSQAKPPHGKRS